jgi:hypothetical protein
LNLVPPKYETGVLTTRPRRSVLITSRAGKKTRVSFAHDACLLFKYTCSCDYSRYAFKTHRGAEVKFLAFSAAAVNGPHCSAPRFICAHAVCFVSSEQQLDRRTLLEFHQRTSEISKDTRKHSFSPLINAVLGNKLNRVILVYQHVTCCLPIFFCQRTETFRQTKIKVPYKIWWGFLMISRTVR